MTDHLPRLRRLRYGPGLTFGEVRARVKDLPREEVSAGLRQLVADGVLCAVRREAGGCAWWEFTRKERV